MNREQQIGYISSVLTDIVRAQFKILGLTQALKQTPKHERRRQLSISCGLLDLCYNLNIAPSELALDSQLLAEASKAPPPKNWLLGDHLLQLGYITECQMATQDYYRGLSRKPAKLVIELEALVNRLVAICRDCGLAPEEALHAHCGRLSKALSGL